MSGRSAVRMKRETLKRVGAWRVGGVAAPGARTRRSGMEDELMEWRLLLEMPDEDAEALKRTALGCGTTVAGLLEAFVSDLVGSPGANGELAGSLAVAWLDNRHGVARDGSFEAWLAESGTLDKATEACIRMEEKERRVSRVMEEAEGGYGLVMGEKVPWYLCEDDHGHPYDTLEEWKAARQEEARALQDGAVTARGYFRGMWDTYAGSGRESGNPDALLAEKAAAIAGWARNTRRGMTPKSSGAGQVPVRDWKRDGRYRTEYELTVELSDGEARRLREAAFGRGLTVPRLLASFVHDLLGGDMILDEWKRCAMPEGLPSYLEGTGQLQGAVKGYGKVLFCEEQLSACEDAIAYGAAGDVPWTACVDRNGEHYESREAWNRDLREDIKVLQKQMSASWTFLCRQWDDYKVSPHVRPGNLSMRGEPARLSEASDKVAGELEPVMAMMVRKREMVPEKRKELAPSL